MPVMSLTLVAITAVLLIIGVPIAVALGLSSILVLVIYQPIPNMQLVPQLLSEATTSFILIAVPLFIMAGVLMERGTIGRNLIDFCTSIVGWMRGGLGACTIVASMIFGGISGSSLADTATFGTIIVPRMVEDGYKKSYAGAVTLCSSCLAVVIPPSILIVLAAASTQQSVSKALAGGILPGILITVLLLIPNYFISKKNDYGTKMPFSFSNVIKKFNKCWTALIAPLIILGSIFSGEVTPTEGAAVAVLYVLFIDGIIFRRLGFSDVMHALKSVAAVTSAILFIATSSAIANWIIAIESLPQVLAKWLLSSQTGQVGFLLFIDLILLIIGATIDATPATLIFCPLFLPVAIEIGVDPIHFLMIMVVGFAIGLTTPPYGVCLFSISAICKIPIDSLVKEAVPFYGILIVALLVVTFVPELTLFLPRILGL